MREKILLVEDADSLREVLCSLLEGEGYAVDAVGDAEAALGMLAREKYSCILADFKLPKKNGLELLKETREISQDVPFVIMTAFGSIEIAVEAMKLGANEFICKPFEPEHFCRLVHELFEHTRVLDRFNTAGGKRERAFLTNSPNMKQIMHQATKVARVDTSVLIVGESGTGKELVARYIHEHSSRAAKPFVAINCAAVPAELLESEFFGHEAGSFTGATQTRLGVFEIASEGTIFLDEVGDMPLPLQVKLLRSLQEREIKRVGGTKTIKINPRVIAATNQDIESSLASGRLREDFYYRIAVVTLAIPPLRERAEDIELLSGHYLEHFANKIGKASLRIDEAAKSLMRAYVWPGNARELENVIERAAILAENDIHPEHLGLAESALTNIIESTVSLPEVAMQASRKAEVDLIKRILAQTLGNKTKAAQILGVSYKTLLNKVKEYSIELTPE